MPSVLRGLRMVVVLAAVALPVFGATPAEFYLSMLQKGVSAFEAGRYDAATDQLRISAFGLVDSVPHYQTAHVYLTLAYDRLGQPELATQSARRVVTAERIEPRYNALPLPAQTRTAFETVARKVLSAVDLSALQRETTAPAPQVARAPATTTAVTTPPAQTRPTQTQATPSRPKPEPAKPQTQPDRVKPEPAKPQPVKVEPVPAQTRPQQPAQTTPSPKTAETPAQSKPAPAVMSPAPTTAAPRPATSAPKPADAVNVTAKFAAAEQALASARLNEARTTYRELLDVSSLDRPQLLRLAEGLYRARDFGPTLRAFNRLGTLRRGEEPYRYYIAVALYETGQYVRAKQELTAVLPYIEITPDVARYKSKIEGAVN